MSRDWSEKEGPLSDDLDRRVRAVLERLDPDAAAVMRVQGKRQFEELAEMRQRRIDTRESSHAISEAIRPLNKWRLMGHRPRTRAEEIADANRPRPGQWPGRNNMTDEESAEWESRAWPGLDELAPTQRADTDGDAR